MFTYKVVKKRLDPLTLLLRSQAKNPTQSRHTAIQRKGFIN
jgi:hypothetical protein